MENVMQTRATFVIVTTVVIALGWIFPPLPECLTEDSQQHSAIGEKLKTSVIPSILYNLLLSSPSTITMPTPYINRDDIAYVWNIYREDTGHRGLDFSPVDPMVKQYIPFQAVFPGVVDVVALHENVVNGKSFWHVNLKLVHDATWSAWYAFEPMIESKQAGDLQLQKIAVSVGDRVQEGDLLGELYNATASGGSHVHFTLNIKDEPVCPEPYFSPQAWTSIMDIIHRGHPGSDMCY
jgi:Peptidase family M23